LRRALAAVLALVGAVLAMAPGCAAAADPVIAAAGDIACDPSSLSFNGGAGTATECRQMATSDLLHPGLAAVLTLGDNQYECAGYQAFLRSYDPSWGRVKAITHAVPGNHEYSPTGGTDCDPTGNGSGYARYFGEVGGDPLKGYYSFDVGAWHLIALNSNCGYQGNLCAQGSEQEQWLREDLATRHATCTLAFWHHPLFSSGAHRPGIDVTRFLFQALYDYSADVLLTGHDHNYERFAPQTMSGVFDPARGVRQFIVGTGGKTLYAQGTPIANSEARNDSSFGVLELTLHPAGYDWRFVPAEGDSFTDSGSSPCAGAGYARPRAAPFARVSLVPGMRSCNSPNGVHGAPLASPSCNPPLATSNFLTVGTPDANAEPANFTGYMVLRVLGESPVDPTNGDQADVEIEAALTDVRNASDMTDYTGELQGQLQLRITDRASGPAFDQPATLVQFPISATIACVPTPADPDTGSTCNVRTTVDTLIGGRAKEGKRAIWELISARVLDGGPDGLASTSGNAVFARAGVFAP
jgi:hypothetical protein